MSTTKETVEYILDSLGRNKRFTVRAMFGEYALYADSKVVALICNDLLYIKILPASHELEDLCEKDAPYPGARAHYVVSEDQLTSIESLSNILRAVATEVVVKKKKRVK